jgi:type 1 glutamine amidotransferase
MPHNILLITGGEIAYHQYPKAMEVLRSALTGAGMNVTATHDAAAAAELSGYEAAVLFTDGDYFTEAQLESIIGFVQGGGGLVSLHTTAATNKSHAGFSKLIGTRINGGTITRHTAIIEAPNHPILEGVQDFELDDEIHDLVPTDHFALLISAWLKDKKQPLAYEKSDGNGKVIHFATGHAIAGLTQPDWQRIFVRAVEYVIGQG